MTVDDVALDQAFADQLVAAIAFLHEMKLTHTDLKPENILLTTREFSPSTARTARRVPMNIVAPSSTKVKRTRCVCVCVCVLWEYGNPLLPCAVGCTGGGVCGVVLLGSDRLWRRDV